MNGSCSLCINKGSWLWMCHHEGVGGVMWKAGLVNNQITAFGQRGELTTTFEWGSELITAFGQIDLPMTASGWKE